MNDTFSIVAPVMPRRRVDPFWVKLAVASLLMVTLACAFATFVVNAQRTADTRRAALEAQIRSQGQARAMQLAVQAQAAAMDQQARANVGAALVRARAVLSSHGSLVSAGPNELARSQPSLVFVDGPSTAASIISVLAAGSTWGAATMAPSGACYWIRLDADGATSYGTGETCTGRAALAAADPSW
jgi:hypothetical protein